MNLEQAVQLLNWLDEEHRKDKAQIAELASQLTQQYTQVAGLNKTVQDLEERLARLQSQSLRFTQLEQTAGQPKRKSRWRWSNMTNAIHKERPKHSKCANWNVSAAIRF